MKLLRSNAKAFSLVEVTIAVGIAAFSLIPILGLLPTGLQTLKAGNDQAAAANTIQMIASTIRGATPSASGTYVATYGGKTDAPISYTLGGGLIQIDGPFKKLGSDGLPSSNDPRLTAYVEIRPPQTGSDLRTAQISVAWPDTATYSSGKWSNAQGYVNSSISFLPR